MPTTPQHISRSLDNQEPSLEEKPQASLTAQSATRRSLTQDGTEHPNTFTVGSDESPYPPLMNGDETPPSGVTSTSQKVRINRVV